ncbi:MAG: HupE/UreJ family protein [Thiotrichaceae bacterium]|nr:HupE/UreJ family protein [Thiotrichaceae bacterium]
MFSLFKTSLLIILFIVPFSAFSHSDVATLQGGFLSGFLHPIQGVDHVIAMVAVGLWGVFLGRPAIWMLPLVFPLVMAFGGVLGIVGVGIPHIEIGIALSGVVLGLAVVFAWKPPLWLAAVIVACFAIFHGHAHGTELPKATSALVFSVGFVVGTGLLHLCGIAFGELNRFSWGHWIVRAAGLLIALLGLWFLVPLLIAL